RVRAAIDVPRKFPAEERSESEAASPFQTATWHHDPKAGSEPRCPVLPPRCREHFTVYLPPGSARIPPIEVDKGETGHRIRLPLERGRLLDEGDLEGRVHAPAEQ